VVFKAYLAYFNINIFLIIFQFLLIVGSFFSFQFYTAIFFFNSKSVSIMKRSLQLGFAVIAVMMVSAYSSKAQTTANVTLNCVLQNVTSITIGSSFQTTTLTYATAADYTNGVSVSQTGALTAISNQAYSVYVYAGTDLKNGTNTIPVSDVTITPSFSGTNAAITCSAKALAVGSANQVKLIASTAGTTSQAYNLQYSTVGAPSTDFLGKPAGTYAATLTYTITNP
jgi:hypothetical protein